MSGAKIGFHSFYLILANNWTELQQWASVRATTNLRLPQPNTKFHGRNVMGGTVCLVWSYGKFTRRQPCELASFQ